jgi:4-hydroxy-3-methylbut-2-enyl diphosphate reductase
MEIYIAKTSGFCFGVKRAINLAEACSEDNCSEISTLGPLIHNPQVVNKLEDSGIVAKKSLDEIEAGTVIIRSHGVKLEDHEEAERKGLNIVDATCPFVNKAQELVSLLTKEDYTVILLGEREHPEVKGLMSFGSESIRVVNSVDDLKGLPRVKKIGIVAQTTQDIKNLEEVTAFCLGKASEVKVYNTICNATSLRQTESIEIAEKVDLMIVVGGKNSANTKRLAQICEAIQPKTSHIEVSSEIDPKWFDGVSTVGITAGASTPSWVIEEVIKRVSELGDSVSADFSEPRAEETEESQKL